jgi:hypothetical protein
LAFFIVWNWLLNLKTSSNINCIYPRKGEDFKTHNWTFLDWL